MLFSDHGSIVASGRDFAGKLILLDFFAFFAYTDLKFKGREGEEYAPGNAERGAGRCKAP